MIKACGLFMVKGKGQNSELPYGTWTRRIGSFIAGIKWSLETIEEMDLFFVLAFMGWKLGTEICAAKRYYSLGLTKKKKKIERKSWVLYFQNEILNKISRITEGERRILRDWNYLVCKNMAS